MPEIKIQTKFTIATDDGVGVVKMLSERLTTEKFSTLFDKVTLTEYIRNKYSDKQLIEGMNALGNQWLVVYRNGEPAGYCRVTDRGIRPAALTGKRAVRIADFGILKEFQDEDVKRSLLEKCLAACRNTDAIWIHEYTSNPFLSFFEANQFVKENEKGRKFDLPLPSVLLIKMNL